MEITEAIIYAIAIAGSILFTRWVFGIQTIVSELNSQRLLLQKIAEKLGVDKDDIDFAIGKKKK